MRVTQITMGPRRVELLRKSATAHKYGHGSALVFSGPQGATGAARLAARAALRIGAGLVTIAAGRNALADVAGQVTAIMVRDGTDVAAAMSDTRISAACIGPGYGVGAACRSAVLQVLAAGCPVVLDADALTSFTGMAEDLIADLAGANAVLTPHEGEFARLFPDLDLADRVAACAAAADRSGAVVVLKGAQTVVAGARVAVHNADGQRDAPWLATAGSGDVLAGFITGLLARGIAPQEAAEMAVWLHAQAARRFGPGLIAEDLSEEIPGVFRDLGV